MTLDIKCEQIRSAAAQLLNDCGAAQRADCFVPALVALYYNVMDVRPKSPRWSDRDRMITAPGLCHAAHLAILADRGYFPLPECMNPEALLPGLETLPLLPGEDMAAAVDCAARLWAEGRSARCFLLLEQQDCLSGTLWEHALHAGLQGLGSLIVLLCRERSQILPGTENICAKFAAFGFDTMSVDGSDVEAVTLALELPRTGGRPLFLCCEQ